MIDNFSGMIKLDAKVRLMNEPKGNLLGFASITVNNSLVVDGFSVVQGKEGVFVGMPSKADSRGEYRDTAYPVTKALCKIKSVAMCPLALARRFDTLMMQLVPALRVQFHRNTSMYES